MFPINQEIGIIVMELATIIFVALALHFCYIRVLNRNKKKIIELQNSFSQCQINVANLKEKRKYRRISLNHPKCTIRIVDFNEDSLQALNNKTLVGKILDISLGGMKFECSIDFPIRKGVVIDVAFHTEGLSFDLEGTVVRKEVKRGDTYLRYGVAFNQLPAKQETKIQALMNKIDLAKIKTRTME